jgi:hypothetical protein
MDLPIRTDCLPLNLMKKRIFWAVQEKILNDLIDG